MLVFVTAVDVVVASLSPLEIGFWVGVCWAKFVNVGKCWLGGGWNGDNFVGSQLLRSVLCSLL